MQKKKIIRFAESFIIMPIITMSAPFGSLSNINQNIASAPQIVSAKIEYMKSDGVLALNQVSEQKDKILELEANAIDTYFKTYKMPLEGLGKKMVEEARKNDLDWRLLPAIAVRESTGGIHACQKAEHNFFGWGSCKISFESNEKAIEVVAKNLGGNNPNTAYHYADKNTKEILQKYNPPSIVRHYAEQVMKIMDNIGEEEIISIPDTQVSSYGPWAQTM